MINIRNKNSYDCIFVCDWKNNIKDLFNSYVDYTLDKKDFFNVQRHVKSLVVYNLPDKQNNAFDKYINEEEIINKYNIKELLQYLIKITDRFPARVQFNILGPKEQIYTHRDNYYHLTHCTRFHLPIITNENMFFTVNGKKFNLNEEKLYALNNTLMHSVTNNSDISRIHLILDYVNPNSEFYQVSEEEFYRFKI